MAEGSPGLEPMYTAEVGPGPLQLQGVPLDLPPSCDRRGPLASLHRRAPADLNVEVLMEKADGQ